MVGPAKATISANRLTNSPASGTLTPKRSAAYGITPTMPISVFRMPNTPSVRMSTNNLLLIPFTLPVHLHAVTSRTIVQPLRNERV